jgi:hypothetical protein
MTHSRSTARSAFAAWIAALALPLAAFTSSCIACSANGCSVQVNQLPHTRELVVPVVGIETSGLDLALQVGTLEVIASDGTPELKLSLREAEPGDASASFVGGRLVLSSTSGKQPQVERLVAHVPADLPSLALHTEVGDIKARGLRVVGELKVTNRVGDIALEDCSAGKDARVHGDVGSLRVSRFEGAALELRASVGDVRLSEVRAKNVRVDADIGDVEVLDSELDALDASSNVGDVRCKASVIGKRSLRVGVGSVADEN